jgi:hypothetical protein
VVALWFVGSLEGYMGSHDELPCFEPVVPHVESHVLNFDDYFRNAGFKPNAKDVVKSLASNFAQDLQHLPTLSDKAFDDEKRAYEEQKARIQITYLKSILPHLAHPSVGVKTMCELMLSLENSSDSRGLITQEDVGCYTYFVAYTIGYYLVGPGQHEEYKDVVSAEMSNLITALKFYCLSKYGKNQDFYQGPATMASIIAELREQFSKDGAASSDDIPSSAVAWFDDLKSMAKFDDKFKCVAGNRSFMAFVNRHTQGGIADNLFFQNWYTASNLLAKLVDPVAVF